MKGLGCVQTNSDQLVNGNRLRPDQDEVSIRVPALRRFVGPVRSLTTALAVQCDLTVDEIEDVQMSIDEACALLLPHVDQSRPWLDVRFYLVDARLVAEVEVATTAAVQLDRGSLPWTVLTALCDDVEVAMDGRTLSICFSKLREASRP
jgi:serine/threonine-protein kinase RsbW